MEQQTQFFPPSSERVNLHSRFEINERIHDETVRRLESLGEDSVAITSQLQKLDREWDIERAIQLNASTVFLIGLGLGAFFNRRFFALPVIAAGFLMQHSLFGWCPPVPILRRLGFRTPREIENERFILKQRRGDIRHVGESSEELLRALAR